MKSIDKIENIPIQYKLILTHSAMRNSFLLTTLAFAAFKFLETTKQSNRIVTFVVGMAFLLLSITYSIFIIINLRIYNKKHTHTIKWLWASIFLILVQLFIFFHSLIYFKDLYKTFNIF